MPESLRRRLCAIAHALYRGLAYTARTLYKGLLYSGLAYGEPYAVWLAREMENDPRPDGRPASLPSVPGEVHGPRASDVRRLLKEVEAYARRNDDW